MTITATAVIEDHGSIVVFEGRDEEGWAVQFAADHRPAAELVQAIGEFGEAQCEVPGYMMMGRVEG